MCVAQFAGCGGGAARVRRKMSCFLAVRHVAEKTPPRTPFRLAKHLASYVGGNEVHESASLLIPFPAYLDKTQAETEIVLHTPVAIEATRASRSPTGAVVASL